MATDISIDASTDFDALLPVPELPVDDVPVQMASLSDSELPVDLQPSILDFNVSEGQSGTWKVQAGDTVVINFKLIDQLDTVGSDRLRPIVIEYDASALRLDAQTWQTDDGTLELQFIALVPQDLQSTIVAGDAQQITVRFTDASSPVEPASFERHTVEPRPGDDVPSDSTGREPLTTEPPPVEPPVPTRGELGTSPGEDPGTTVELTEQVAAPTPDDSSETGDRSSRVSRRTLDIRSIDFVPSKSASVTSTVVSPSSIASQTAIRRIFESDRNGADAPGGWILDPMPIRLQVSVFLISRTTSVSPTGPSRTYTRVVDASLPAPMKTVPPTIAPMPSAPTVSRVPEAQPAAAPTSNKVTSVQSVSTSLSYIDRKDEQDRTAEAIEPKPSAYAALVDRLYESPVGLATLVGMTVLVSIPERNDRSSEL